MFKKICIDRNCLKFYILNLYSRVVLRLYSIFFGIRKYGLWAFKRRVDDNFSMSGYENSF